MSAIRPAATLILAAETPTGLTMLMVQRSAVMAFAPGAAVFPGGRVDGDDAVHGALLAPALDPDDAAARVAAIRETLEETGAPVGFDAPPDAPPDAIADARSALLAGRAFSAICAEAGWRPDLAALIPFARWQPPLDEALPRAFDTRFYLARADTAHDGLVVDGTENDRLFWASPANTLAAADAGAARLILPTRRNLERLAQFSDWPALAAHAHAIGAPLIVPHIATRGGVPHLVIRSDAGYPVTAEPLGQTPRA